MIDDLILSAFMREEKFAFKYISVVDEDMFEEFQHKVCLNAYLTYVRTYNTLPSLVEMNTEIHSYCVKYRLDERIESTALALALKCSTLEYNIDYVQDIFIRFATKNKMTNVVLEAAQLIKNKGDQITEGDYEHIQKILTDAMSLKSRESEGIMLADVADDPAGFIKTRNRYDPASVIKTGIRSFDSRHLAGGPVPGEMYVVSAPPGRGKSTLLVNIGANALLQGKDVIHIFVGDNKEEDAVLRYCARLTGVTMAQIMVNAQEYVDSWRRIRENFGLGNLLTVAYPIGGPSVSDLRSFITRSILQRSIEPKLLIVDYIDNCRRNYNRSSYDDLGEMYAQLKSVAEEMGLVVWTASQPTKDTWDTGEAAGLGSLAESSKKQHHVDGLVTMNKTSENTYQMYVPKYRRGSAEFTVDLIVEYDRMFIREAIPGRMAPKVPSSTGGPISADNIQVPDSPY